MVFLAVLLAGPSSAFAAEANFSWAGVYHYRTSATSADALSVGIPSNDPSSLSDLTVQVSGPNLNYTYGADDIYPWAEGVLHLWKSFPALEPGHYTFTVADGQGGSATRTDLHDGAAELPLVNLSTVQFARRSDGGYRISWAPVGGDRTHAYRLRINGADGAPVYVSQRALTSYADVPAGTVDVGQSYQVRIETCDAFGFDLLFNRSQTEYLAFAPSATDADTSITWWRAYNRIEADGSTATAFSVGVADPSIVTLVEVYEPEPGGFHYTFDLTADLIANYNEFQAIGFDPATTATGRYVFHVVANGEDHYAYATLSQAATYPVPDSDTYQAERQQDGSVRFSWAEVDSPGELFYRACVRDIGSGQWYCTGRTDQAQAYVYPNWFIDRVGPGPYEWRAEVYDSSHVTTARNRVNGPIEPLSIIPYDASRPRIDWAYTTHRIEPGFTGRFDLSALVSDQENDILQVLVDGPGGFHRDLLRDGGPWIDQNGVASLVLIEPGPAAPGLYAFTAVDATDRQSVAYRRQSPDESLALIDYRSFHVDAAPGGELRFSWAPVYAPFPLYYRLEIYLPRDDNGDGYSDRVYSTPFDDVTSVVVPAGALPEEPLMFRVRAVDAVHSTLYSNRTSSLFVGFEGPNFDYAGLSDVDGDGYTDNVAFGAGPGATYTLTATAHPGGSIVPAGVTEVLEGSDQTFTITPDPGYEIQNVIAHGYSQGPVGSYTYSDVQHDSSITAYFSPVTHTVSATATAGGTISFQDTAKEYFHGTSPSYYANAAAGYHLADILVDGVPVGPVRPYTFTTIASDHTIHAVFAAEPTWTITAGATGSGKVTPAGTTTVIEADSQSYSFVPDAGHHIGAVLVDGVAIGTPSAYTFSNVTADHTLAVEFVADASVSYTLTAAAQPGGSISPSGEVTVSGGSDQTFTITPDPGYEIQNVIAHGYSQGPVGSYTYSDVQHDSSITAYFSPVTHTVSATATAGGIISFQDTAKEYFHGTSPSYYTNAAAGYHLADILVDGVPVGPVRPYTFTTIASDHTIHAVFAADPAWTITAVAGSGGSITPAGATAVVEGDSQSYSIVPEAGYRIGSVVVDGVNKGTPGSWMFMDVRGDHTIEASFVADGWTVTATAGVGGTISPGTSIVSNGQSITFTITPDPGYRISNVKINGRFSKGAISSYTFTSVTRDRRIDAYFAPL